MVVDKVEKRRLYHSIELTTSPPSAKNDIAGFMTARLVVVTYNREKIGIQPEHLIRLRNYT
jgi:hypothetical protein